MDVELNLKKKKSSKNIKKYIFPLKNYISVVILVAQKSFTASYNLKIHYKIHTGNRPYQFNICRLKYYEEANYKYHCKTAHVKKNNRDTICSHINCQHIFKTKKQKIMHNDKLDEDCMK